MWKQDLVELLELWPDTRLIDSIRLNVFGEIVVETTSNEFYIFRDHTIVKASKSK